MTRSVAPPPTQECIDAAVAGAAPVGQPFVAVVISALDEAATIREVLELLPAELERRPVRAVVVDDGSRDDTASVAAAAGAVVAVHPANLGQGEGLRTGFAVALALGAEVVATMDADGQHDPGELATLVTPVLEDHADYVQGSRFLGAYDDAGGARHLGIRGFTAVINLLTGAGITDCTNGYRAIRADGLARMRLVEDRFSASEILIEAAGRGLRMLEVPVHIQSRVVGESRKPRGLKYAGGYLSVIVRSWRRSRRTGAAGVALSEGAERSL
jgi:glycosyltransferase involved in cell wall biosynthesis